ncbi:hotdog fold domain-containing protein [Streptomyces sp. NPDC046821]|uniref:hotdog fold domain-containing protein n=1 Tax=Streptomyces sp. NPDC046821 TaxID=3154702 RepID=UPI0033EEBB41
MMDGNPTSTTLRVRLRADDTKYAGGVIPAAHYMQLMSDAGAMLGVMRGESAGYLARWESVDFTAVCYVGDYIEVRCELIRVGNRSRTMRTEVVKLISTNPGERGQTTKGIVHEPPEVVARGDYVSVMPRADLDGE